MARIFISYKRNVDPDQDLAGKLFRRFKDAHTIFIDQVLAPGVEWARRINDELTKCDFLFLLVSAASVESEMVRAEVETVRNVVEKPPTIIPIRVSYDKSLIYPLSAYLNHLQWVDWRGPDSDEAMFLQLQAALDGRDLSGPTAVPTQKALAGSARPKTRVANLRIPRSHEQFAITALDAEPAVTLNIRAPRYMGKSLLATELVNAVENNRSTIVIDFKLFDGRTLSDPERFYRVFSSIVAEEIGLEQTPDGDWGNLPLQMSCTKVVKAVIRKHKRRTLLLLEELDRLLDATLRNDFFGMLRSWHEERSQLKSPFRSLDLVLAASVDLEQFTQGADFSPFNVGIPVDLTDFSEQETLAMADLGGVDRSIGQRLHHLLSGHPWLTNRAIEATVSGRLTVSSDTTAEDLIASNIFSDHLRHYLLQLNALPDRVRDGVRLAMAGNPCEYATFARLEGAGLLKGTRHAPKPRCELYRAFFVRELA